MAMEHRRSPPSAAIVTSGSGGPGATALAVHRPQKIRFEILYNSHISKGDDSMPILRIQHSVANFEGWKRAFDKDPIDRKKSGVRRYRIHRSVADPDFVMIDLEFDSAAEAEAILEKLRLLWAGPGGAVMRNPEAWILETVESREV